VRAARGEDGLPRPPAWMMRQAGRYMAEYQALAKRHPSFRERSENTDLIVEITLQPWRAFAPDGVILFSDILTPLPAIGVPFDISDSKGPVIQSPVRSKEQVRQLVPIDLDMLQFVGESLKILRNEVMPVSLVPYICSYGKLGSIELLVVVLWDY
jgi:uroporphyrinogen decarboxylase